MTGVDGVFLIQDDDLVEMGTVPYATEDELQSLLESHPSLLAGQQLNPDKPRHFLLVAREAGVPAQVGGPDQWSADHLFVDQDGVPTIVEVKRSTDTRVRREVVGQMLDYAANGVRNWPVERLRRDLSSRVGGDEAADRAVVDLLLRAGSRDVDPDSFWSQVDDNLRLGRLRLLFVADVIPASLRRIIEFLNEQMDRCEVLGVEIRQYRADDHHVVVPTVVGHTSESRRRKTGAHSRSFEELLADASSAIRGAEQRLGVIARREGWSVTTLGKSRRYSLTSGETIAYLYPADGGGAMEFPFVALSDSRPVDESADLLAELEILAGQNLARHRPWVRIEALLQHWDSFAEGWLPRFKEAIARAGQSQSNPSAGELPRG